ncbi:hypothetical protein [Lentzea sp. NBRC 105346]|uniref:hypothetical protein n=1 Tax=Lentzea sp. NBRC 105346 TaxID=3032205 RepID=UPI002556DF76|nr:hypothetical protein [Lentzea sp. NBRC 105346]
MWTVVRGDQPVTGKRTTTCAGRGAITMGCSCFSTVLVTVGTDGLVVSLGCEVVGTDGVVLPGTDGLVVSLGLVDVLGGTEAPAAPDVAATALPAPPMMAIAPRTPAATARRRECV